MKNFNINLLSVALLLGCGADDKHTGPETGDPSTDDDGDGWLEPEDCNDHDATIHPGVVETCNSTDDDCNGEVDDGIDTTWYADDDEDGYGDPLDAAEDCSRPAGHVPTGTDCDDADSSSYPGAAERCDGQDNDCDDEIDDGFETVTWYPDTDGDGFGDDAGRVEDCDTPDGEGWTEIGGDCDDTNPDMYPGADGERPGDGVDTDCDGLDVTPFVDEDFEDGTPGEAVQGTGCWTCGADTCDETFDDDWTRSGGGALSTSASTTALLFCAADGFGSDFAFESWFWDDGSAELEHRIVFQQSSTTGSAPAVFVGFHTELCGPDTYCVMQIDADLALLPAVPLGARSGGWHRISATATYTAADAADWELCVDDGVTTDDGTCASLSSSGYAIGAFRLHHDGFATWVDDVLAWSI